MKTHRTPLKLGPPVAIGLLLSLSFLPAATADDPPGGTAVTPLAVVAPGFAECFTQSGNEQSQCALVMGGTVGGVTCYGGCTYGALSAPKNYEFWICNGTQPVTCPAADHEMSMFTRPFLESGTFLWCAGARVGAYVYTCYTGFTTIHDFSLYRSNDCDEAAAHSWGVSCTGITYSGNGESWGYAKN